MMIRSCTFATIAGLITASSAVVACSDAAPPAGSSGVANPAVALPAPLPPAAPPPPGGVVCPAGQAAVNGACVPAPPVPPPPPGPPVVVVPGCNFSTHTIFVFQGRVIDSITNRGRLFNFEADGTPWASNGMDLTQVPYFAQGPCAGRAPGQCIFDTRTFALFPGNHLVEFVTAYGRSWAWENGTPTDSGTDLVVVARYQEICALRGAGPCIFDTRTFVNVDGQLMEAITAYGRYFAFDRLGNRSKDNGVDLALVPRYAAGPCVGTAPGQCRFDTRTYGLVDNRTVEVLTAKGHVWRYLAGPESGFAEVQPSGAPLLNVPTWVSVCQ